MAEPMRKGETVRRALLVEAGIAAVALSILTESKIHKPQHTPEGLEFDLGDSDALEGKTARVMLKLRPTDLPIQRDIEL